MRATRLIFTATVALAMLAAISCKKKDDGSSTTEGAGGATITDTPAENSEAINPAWKTKCPEADRPLAGTVTALKNLTVHKAPQEGSDHVGSIGPGTWVNLLGIKTNWYCIDFPCEVGKLCPGWVEEQYTQRKTVTKDAGVVDAAVAVPVPEAGVVDSGKSVVSMTTDAGGGAAGAGGAGPASTTKLPPGGRPPPIKKK
jgi:hypothetical protein